MAHGKFAAVTSDLLARKGEAAPWTATERAPLPWRQDAPPVVFTPPAVASNPLPPLVPSAPPPLTPEIPPDKIKRCSVRLSGQEYERLGLMAVKKDVTRQHLLQAALSQVLADMARELARDCACLGKSCAGVCGHNG